MAFGLALATGIVERRLRRIENTVGAIRATQREEDQEDFGEDEL